MIHHAAGTQRSVSVMEWRESELDEAAWKSLIEQAKKEPIACVEAHSYRNVKSNTYSAAVLLACNDGREYFVKGRQQPRGIANERIVGYLAMLVTAPIPPIQLVAVSADLIAQNDALKHMPPGLCHGSLSLYPAITDKITAIQFQHLPQNRARFASLAFLYGWFGANDPQYFYTKNPPELVWSLDHGHFFHGGPDWQPEHLSQAPPATPYQPIMSACNFSREEITMAKQAYLAVTNQAIANAVASPPDEWGLSFVYRVLAAQYLAKRLREILRC